MVLQDGEVTIIMQTIADTMSLARCFRMIVVVDLVYNVEEVKVLRTMIKELREQIAIG